MVESTQDTTNGGVSTQQSIRWYVAMEYDIVSDSLMGVITKFAHTHFLGA
jgi:hypothetical protein